ncbi:hypothetical protein Tco_0939068 [Tanacetum coccineum]|uniref:Uncharacterized protein n=1 Tax=Tanacetum coccineum TaxID=301880 RepID=A0ABQ5DJY3_9ASTR
MAATYHSFSSVDNLVDPIETKGVYYSPKPRPNSCFSCSGSGEDISLTRGGYTGIQGHLLGVPIQEELTALRFRVDIAEAENASLRARIKTVEAVEKVTHNHKRLARIGI